MAIKVRKTAEDMQYALVVAWNDFKEASVASFFHADVTQLTTGSPKALSVASATVSTANASNLATSVALVNAIKVAYNRHCVDSIAHNTAVSAVVATADATDLATAITLANALKAAYNTHLSASNVHFTNDSTNAVSASNATDQTDLNTLLNEMKGDFNAHIISAPLGYQIELVDP